MTKKVFGTSLFLFLLAVGTAFAQAPAEYTSAAAVAKDAAVKKDFDIQGEYTGQAAGMEIGVNVIADGGGKFRIAAFIGGLPGDGWFRGDLRILGKATLNEAGKLDVALEEMSDFQGKRKLSVDDVPFLNAVADVEPGKSLSFKIDGEDAVFKKTERKSPTLGQKAPEGASVIFADGTKGELFDKGNVNEEAKTLWSEAVTKPFEKKPYKLHIEFLLSYMPEAKGQGRANSGVYIDETYECQVLDSFGLEGENNECGGFYQSAKPKVNMCYPPLQWQTYDIDYTPPKFDADGTKTAKAKITVKHNGFVIQDSIEMEKETPGRKKETSALSGLYLQGHGNKVQYNNIWIKYQ
ncbi:MAG: DUF1080 domain-containing protein [Planctomycetaceae bacterium]|jgi:hypothetical protein|nr:DUF1080 domain-containing protein [Planctomycetaceae bacterium]